jgi:hypothetical protein
MVSKSCLSVYRIGIGLVSARYCVVYNGFIAVFIKSAAQRGIQAGRKLAKTFID